MKFKLDITPSTVTAQEKKVCVVKGRPIFYDPPKVQTAKAELMVHLHEHRPKEPMEGAVFLKVVWMFPKGRTHKDGEWRTTRPDTDNLQKMLKDCMTKTGYWKDDAQVVREVVEKRWADNPGIEIQITEAKL